MVALFHLVSFFKFNAIDKTTQQLNVVTLDSFNYLLAFTYLYNLSAVHIPHFSQFEMFLITLVSTIFLLVKSPYPNSKFSGANFKCYPFCSSTSGLVSTKSHDYYSVKQIRQIKKHYFLGQQCFQNS